MDFLIQQIDRLVDDLQSWNRQDTAFGEHYNMASSEALQLLKDYAPDSYFFKQAEGISSYAGLEENSKTIVAGLRGFRNYIVNGLSSAVSLVRRAQIEVVSDLLSQAEDLLNDKNIHPVAPIVIIGAALEEFLRNWCVDEKLMDDVAKGSIDRCAQALRNKELIEMVQ